MDPEDFAFVDFMESTRIEVAEETHRRLESEWRHEYAVHAPITYSDAKQFLVSLGKPDTVDNTMKMLAEMRSKYAQEMLAAMKKADVQPASKGTCSNSECCYNGQPRASTCLCYKEG